MPPFRGAPPLEIDPGNLDLGGIAQVNVSGFLGEDSASLVPTTRANIIGLATDIAAHELGHLSGLQHQDALGPIGSGIFSGMSAGSFSPTYTGPANATATPQDVMASPDSVGTTLLDAAGVNGATYLGQRDAIKLAFNDTGTVLQRQNLTAVPVSVSTALPNGIPFMIDNAYVLPALPTLAVPNTLPAGVTGSGLTDSTTALAVNGTLFAPNEEDFYAFTGQAGQLMNFQVISATNTLNPYPILPELVLVGPNGQVVAYNQHEFESSDSTLLDVTLPATGTYYVGVDSYKQTTVGNYQLFMYSFATSAGPSQGGGDTLVGGNGNDTLIGSSGNDYLAFPSGSAGNATILAGSGQDVINIAQAPSEHITTTGNVTLTQPVSWTPPANITYGTALSGTPTRRHGAHRSLAATKSSCRELSRIVRRPALFCPRATISRSLSPSRRVTRSTTAWRPPARRSMS